MVILLVAVGGYFLLVGVALAWAVRAAARAAQEMVPVRWPDTADEFVELTR